MMRLLALFLLQASGESPAELVESARAAHLKGDLTAALATLDSAAKLTAADASLTYEIHKQQYAVLASAARFADAEAKLQEAITWKESRHGETHPDVAADLTLLAFLTRARSDPDRGLAILNRVRQLHIKANGIDCLQLADDFSRTAQFYIDKKDAPTAAAVLDAGIRIRQIHNGPDHPSLLPDLDRLAAIVTANSEYPRGEAAYRRALLIRERVEGRSDPDLLQTLDGLAYTLFGQERFAEAEPFYERLLKIWESSTGLDHPMIALTLDKIATFRRAQGKPELADAASERAMAVRALLRTRRG